MTQPPGPYQPGQPTNPWPAPDEPGQPTAAPTGPYPFPAGPPPLPQQPAPPYSSPPAPYPESVPPAPYPGAPQSPGAAPQYPQYPHYPDPTQSVPGSAPPAPPYPGAPPPYPVSAAPGGYPPYLPPPPKKHTGVIVTVIVLVAVVLLGAGGTIAAVLLSRDPNGPGGRPTADSAVQAFLQAIYVDQSVTKAAPLVCADARDNNKLTAKINEIKGQDQQYDSPKYSWPTPRTETSGADRAVLSTTVTLTTANTQRATLDLRFTAIKTKAWFVCDVQKI